MKILCISDLHGNLTEDLYVFASDGNFDLILVAGDLTDSEIFRKIQFDNWEDIQRNGKTLEEIMGTKRYNEALERSAKSIMGVLERLEALCIPVLVISGNADYCEGSLADKGLGRYELKNAISYFENILYADDTVIEMDDITIISHGGYRGTKARLTRAQKEKNGSYKMKGQAKLYKKALEQLFSKMKDQKRTIFLTHDIPYDTRIDLVDWKESPMHGKHVGDDIYRHFIETYRPAINVCGHMHENQGKETLDDTQVVNCGYGHDGQCAIITIDNKDRIRIEFRK